MPSGNILEKQQYNLCGSKREQNLIQILVKYHKSQLLNPLPHPLTRRTLYDQKESHEITEACHQYQAYAT